MPAEIVAGTSGRLTGVSDGRKDGTGQFIRDVFFANVPLPFQKLRTYVWIVLLSRALGPSGFGLWALFQTTLGTGLILTTMTQGNAMMRFLSGNRTREETNAALSSVLAAVSVSSVILALVLAGFSRQLSDLLFRDERGRTVLLLLALTIPLETYFEQLRGLLRARRLNRSWAFFTLGRQLPETVLLIAVVWWWRKDPMAAIGTYVLTAALGVLLGSVYLSRNHQAGLVKPSRAVISKYVPYGLAIVPGALASALAFAGDRYLVGYYLDLRQVGIYSVCLTVSGLGSFFCGPLSDVLLPEMAALHDAGDWNQFYTRFSGVQKIVTGLAVGATSLLIAFPQEILRTLTTRDFSSGGSTLAVLGLQGVFMSIVMLYIVILYVRLRVWWTTVIWTSMGVIVLLIDCALLPRVGIVGAGFGQLIASIAGAVAVVLLSKHIFCRTFRFVWIAQTGAALLGVEFLAHFWKSGALSVGHSLARIAVGAIAFLLGLFVTGYVRVGELSALQKALSRSAA